MSRSNDFLVDEELAASEPVPSPAPPVEQPREYLHLPKNVLEHIFTALGPRDLAIASGVSSSWHAAAVLAPWNAYYATRWPISPSISAQAVGSSWHSVFSSRMALARSFRGRPQLDRLPGHNSGVKAAQIIPESNLLLTGSVDRRLSLWDLETGTHLASSALHAGTVRCLAMDTQLLATGSSDHRIRVWRPISDSTSNEEPGGSTLHAVGGAAGTARARRVGEFPFAVEGTRTVLAGGHAGPVSALELAPTAMFSGSWDYCVRVWDRSGTFLGTEDSDISSGGAGGGAGGGFLGEGSSGGSTEGAAWPNLRCVQVLHFEDWVTDMNLKAGRLLVAAGHAAHVVDAAGGGGLRPLFSLQRHASSANVTAVQGTEDGRFLFYAEQDGGVFACDLRAPLNQHGRNGNSYNISASQQPQAFNAGEPGFSCSSAITGLSWDYPWLAASLQNGEVLLLNAENSLLGGYGGAQQSGSGASRRRESAWASRALAAGVSGGAQCVDLAGRWLVAGYESGATVSWDFSKAEEAERAAEALRVGRRKERERRREVAKAQKRRGGGDRKNVGVVVSPRLEESKGEGTACVLPMSNNTNAVVGKSSSGGLQGEERMAALQLPSGGPTENEEDQKDAIDDQVETNGRKNKGTETLGGATFAAGGASSQPPCGAAAVVPRASLPLYPRRSSAVPIRNREGGPDPLINADYGTAGYYEEEEGAYRIHSNSAVDSGRLVNRDGGGQSPSLSPSSSLSSLFDDGSIPSAHEDEGSFHDSDMNGGYIMDSNGFTNGSSLEAGERYTSVPSSSFSARAGGAPIRVPAPVSLARSPGGSGRGEGTWHVLRMKRSNSGSTGGGGGGGGGGAPGGSSDPGGST